MQKRKKVVLDPKFQLAVTLPMASVLLVAGIGYITTLRALADPELGPMGASLVQQGHATAFVFFLTAFAGSVLVGLRVTHKIAGPLYVLRRAVQGLRDGKYDERVQLRKGDFLKPLAQEICELGKQLEGQDALMCGIREAAARGDLDAVRGLMGEDRKLRESA